jgi:hypothetical protein
VNCTGVDDCGIESICNFLFQHDCKLCAKDELDKVDNIIYQPPPLHEVWLDEAGQCQGNKHHIHQHCQNEDFIHDCNHSVKKVIPTPLATNLDDADKVLGVAPISDDSSVDSSLLSHDSESEGGI